MKIKILCVLFILCFFNVVGCAQSSENARFIKAVGMEKSETESIYPLSADVTLTIKEVPVSIPLPEFLTLIYTNNSDSETYIGSHAFQIEKKFKNTWYVFPGVEGYGVLSAETYINPLSNDEVKCYISQYHENMGDGLFRVVCRVQNAHTQNHEIVICEFIIE